MRAASLASIFLLLLAGCGGEPENIQTKADNMARELEARANQLSAEADNSINALVAPLDNEAEALLDQANSAAGNGAADAAANAQ